MALNLAKAKHKCDTDLTAFLECLHPAQPGELNEPSEPSRHGGPIYSIQSGATQQDSLQPLQEMTKEMISLSTSDAANFLAHCQRIIDRARKFQHTWLKEKEKLSQVPLITKFLLIVSRVSRLAEHMESVGKKNRLPSSSSELLPPRDNLISSSLPAFTLPPQPLSPLIAAISPAPTATAPPDISAQAVGAGSDDPDRPKVGIQVSAFVSYVVSKIRNWKTQQQDGADSVLPSDGAKQDSPMLMCRICEEMVPSNELEEHSKDCEEQSEADMSIITCDCKLEKIAKLADAMAANAASARISTNDPLLARLAILCRRILETRSIPDLEGLAALASNLASEGGGGDEAVILMDTRNIKQWVGAMAKHVERLISEKLKWAVIAPARRAPKNGIRDFEIIKPISLGAFGKVFLARKKSTGDIYSIKVLNKNQAVQKNQVANIKAERSILLFFFLL